MRTNSTIRPKYKPCKECLKDSLIWSKGRCMICSQKASNKPIQRKPMSRTFTASGELPLFKELWLRLERKSFVSGKPIMEFHPIHFAHVVPKSTFPHLRLAPSNIVLLTEEEHSLYDQGTARQREKYAQENPNTDWSKLYELRDRLRTK